MFFNSIFCVVFLTYCFDDVWGEGNKEGPTLTFMTAVRETTPIKLDRMVALQRCFQATTLLCTPVDDISIFCVKWSKFL